MGRRRKSLQVHLLNGTYRADRHGPLPDSERGYFGMYEHEGYSTQAGTRGCTNMSEPDEDEPRYPGLEYDYDRKMLVGADSLAWCFECDASTIRRWASNGRMPKPLKVGGRTLWDAEGIREWIRQGCPRCDA